MSGRTSDLSTVALADDSRRAEFPCFRTGAARYDDGMRVGVTAFYPGTGGNSSKRTMQGAIVLVSADGRGWIGSSVVTITPIHSTRLSGGVPLPGAL
jgi:hypothetical protein